MWKIWRMFWNDVNIWTHHFPGWKTPVLYFKSTCEQHYAKVLSIYPPMYLHSTVLKSSKWKWMILKMLIYYSFKKIKIKNKKQNKTQIHVHTNSHGSIELKFSWSLIEKRDILFHIVYYFYFFNKLQYCFCLFWLL